MLLFLSREIVSSLSKLIISISSSTPKIYNSCRPWLKICVFAMTPVLKNWVISSRTDSLTFLFLDSLMVSFILSVKEHCLISSKVLPVAISHDDLSEIRLLLKDLNVNLVVREEHSIYCLEWHIATEQKQVAIFEHKAMFSKLWYFSLLAELKLKYLNLFCIWLIFRDIYIRLLCKVHKYFNKEIDVYE